MYPSFFGVTSIRLVLSVPAFIYFSEKVANIYDIDLGLYLTAVGLIRLSYGILPDMREAFHSFWKNISSVCQCCDKFGICDVYFILLFPHFVLLLPHQFFPIELFY